MKLSKKQLQILFECWKNGDNTKSWLKLIEEQLPKIPPLTALSIMRKMAKIDPDWQKALKRKENKQEKQKKEKQKEKEQKRAAAIQKKQEREKKKLEKNKLKAEKEQLNSIRNKLKQEHINIVIEKIGIEYSFCPDISQYTNNLSCVFKAFSEEYLDSKCQNCSKMNKYIPILEEILNVRQKIRRNRTSKNRGEIEKKNSST